MLIGVNCWYLPLNVLFPDSLLQRFCINWKLNWGRIVALRFLDIFLIRQVNFQSTRPGFLTLFGSLLLTVQKNAKRDYRQAQMKRELSRYVY